MSTTRYGLLLAKGLESEGGGVDRIIAQLVHDRADEVEINLGIVAADKATVAADKALVAADKAIVAGYKDDAQAAAGFRVGVARKTLTALNALAGPFGEGASAAVYVDGANNGIYSYTSGAWEKDSDLPELAAVNAKDAAIAAAAQSIIGISETGSDATDHATSTQGTTTPNTTSESANCIGPNTVNTRPGPLSFSVRMSASGTGNIVVLDRTTNKVIKRIPITVASGINTFTPGVSGFPIVEIPKNCLVFYELLTGGFARYVTGSGSTARIPTGVAIGSVATVTTAVHDAAVTWSTTGPTSTLRQRVSQAESTSILRRLPAVWEHGYDCEQGSGSILPDFMGGMDIDLSGAVNLTWGKGYVETTNGYFKTPIVANIKTVLIFCRTTENSTAGYLYCSPSQKAVGQQAGGSFANFDNQRAAGGWGRHTLARRNDSGGSAAYEINGGGWVAYVFQLAAGETGIHAFGALVNNSAACDNLKTATILWTSGDVTDAEMDQTVAVLSAAKKPRDIYLLSRDCPILMDPFFILGDSNAQGSAKVSDLSADQLAFRFLETLSFGRDAASSSNLFSSAPASAFRVGVNHGPPGKITEAEIGFAYQLARGMEERGWTGRKRLMATIAQGSTYMGPSGTYSNAIGGSTVIGANQTFHPGELPTAGRFYITLLRQLYKLDQNMRLAGIGLAHPVEMIRSVSSNDRYVGTGYVTSAATFQQWTEDFRAAIVLYTGWQIFRDILIPGPPGDPDLVGNANRQTADSYCNTGLANYAAVDSTARKVMDPATWATNAGADAVHYSVAGTVTGSNAILDHAYSAAPKLPLFPTSLASAFA